MSPKTPTLMLFNLAAMALNVSSLAVEKSTAIISVFTVYFPYIPNKLK